MFFAYFTKSLCAWQCIGRLPKSIGFYDEKSLISEPDATKIHPKSTPKHKNAKVEAKSSRKSSREVVETDFGHQEIDFGTPKGQFWRPKGGGSSKHEDFGGRPVEWRRPIAKLDYGEYSWNR